MVGGQASQLNKNKGGHESSAVLAVLEGSPTVFFPSEIQTENEGTKLVLVPFTEMG